jgi:hypothetical protein
MRHHHDNGQVQDLGVELQKASGLGKEAVLESRLGVHLHLQQHHRPIRPAGLCASGPEHPIEAMVDRFELSGVKAIQHITWRILAERGRRRDPPHWQKQDDQIGGALEEPVEPVIGFHTSHPDCSRVHLYCSVGRPCFHGLSCRAAPHRGPYPCIRIGASRSAAVGIVAITSAEESWESGCVGGGELTTPAVHDTALCWGDAELVAALLAGWSAGPTAGGGHGTGVVACACLSQIPAHLPGS